MAGAKVIATDIDRVLDEMKRTLKASGILAIEGVLGWRKAIPRRLRELS